MFTYARRGTKAPSDTEARARAGAGSRPTLEALTLQRRWAPTFPDRKTGDNRFPPEADSGEHTAQSESVEERRPSVPNPTDASVNASPDTQVQRPSRECGESKERDVKELASVGARELPYRGLLERSFGPQHPLDGVRVSTGPDIARLGRRLGVEAFTVGENVAFARQPDLFLAAHEAAHVVQQRAGLLPPGRIGRRGDAFEQQANEVARHVVQNESASSLLPAVTRGGSTLRTAFQAQYSGATGMHNPAATIPLADFIRYVESVERAYPSDSPTDILTRIRVQYYSGIAFEQLIPGAHTSDFQIVSGGMGPPMGVSIPRTLSSVRLGQEDPAAFEHLTARADENALGDNPSPYIVLPSGEQVDVGHLFLGMDALIHPSTGAPYSSYGVPGIDPASWVADIGIAAVWTTQHDESGSSPGDAPVHPASSSLDTYWAASAPEADLLGDVDSFAANAAFSASPGAKLSQALSANYLGRAGAAPGTHRRYRTFCAANGFSYTMSGVSVVWDPGLRARVIPRVDRFNDLFAAGKAGSLLGSVLGPTRRAWPHTPAVVDRFLNWLKPRLEAEIAAHP
jgi:hypothetical protein